MNGAWQVGVALSSIMHHSTSTEAAHALGLQKQLHVCDTGYLYSAETGWK
jgi:hypothetical protein